MAILWNQPRCSAVSGNTSRSADQDPSAPSPMASTGARMPRRLPSRTRSAEDSADSRRPSASATSSVGLGAHPEQHQQAQLALVKAEVDVNTVGPQIHVVHAGRVPLGERAGLCFPRSR